VRERVEMSFESVRLEKSEPNSPRGLGIVGSPETGARNVSGASAVGVVQGGTPLVGTPAEMGWMSPQSVLKVGFKWS
jgi:hypothetical protein